jgi:lipopolysaccharide biosynthesis glycosyltransferase
MYEVSSPTFVDYAKRCGADYIVIDSQKILMSHLFYEKWQIFDMLFDYDRILYLDSDILVAPDCPNLFSFVQPDDVGAFVEDDFEERTALIFRTQLEHGCLNWFKGYVNAGMGVFSWLHRPLFKKGKSRDTSCLTEQNLLNFRIQLNQMPIHKLPKEFNRMDLAGEDKRLQSFLIHYAGRGHTGKAWTGDPVETLKTKIEIMRADRKWLEENRRA